MQTPASPALELVCTGAECLGKMAESCRKVLPCGHPCGGVVGETSCLPCVQGCDGGGVDGDAYCPVCSETFRSAPTVQLSCSHVIHVDCARAMLAAGYSGPRISFGFMGCPSCRSRMEHPMLAESLQPHLALEAKVRDKALLRLKYDNLEKCEELVSAGSPWLGKPAEYAMNRYAYYRCFKCKGPYFGGERACRAADDSNFDPSELLCGGCAPHSADAVCAKHGTDYIEFKCRFCCSIAVYFCFGTTHFCNECHDQPGHMQSMQASNQLPKCPAAPLGRQLQDCECPLKVKHPPMGEEFALGCGICRNASTF